MEVICIESEAFYELIETVVQRLQGNTHTPKNKWINKEEAMQLLNIKSSTTLQALRDNGEIAYTQPRKRLILYDRESIEAYLEKHNNPTF